MARNFRRPSILTLSYVILGILFVSSFTYYMFYPIELYLTTEQSDTIGQYGDELIDVNLEYYEDFNYYFTYQLPGYNNIENNYVLQLEINSLTQNENILKFTVTPESGYREFVSLDNIIHPLFDDNRIDPELFNLRIFLELSDATVDDPITEDVWYVVVISSPISLHSDDYLHIFAIILLMIIIAPIFVKRGITSMNQQLKIARFKRGISTSDPDVRDELAGVDKKSEKHLIRKKNQEDLDEITENAEKDTLSRSKDV